MHILLVEDHADTARVMRKLLEKNCHIVTLADSIAAALGAAKNGEIELLICDLGLPDGSGLDLMRELKRLYNLQGICLSGFGTEDAVEQSKMAGFAAHLTKPVDISRLEMVIRQLAPE